jgi:hypothetical protein
LDEAGSDEGAGAAVEVDDCGSGEEWVEAAGVAEVEHDARDPGAFGRCVELPGDRRDEFVAGVDVVVGCGLEEPVDLGTAELWEGERELEVEFGEFDQLVEELLEFVVVEAAQTAGGVVGMGGEERSREGVFAGSAVLAAAAFGLAA